MANSEQLAAIQGGHPSWNTWRWANRNSAVDLSGADLRGVDVSLIPAIEAAERESDYKFTSWAFIANEVIGYDVMPLDLRAANFRGAKLDGLDLRCAECEGADFSRASLRGAQLGRANLQSARFFAADLSEANLRGADLSQAVFVKTKLDDTDLGWTRVYGVSVWDVSGTPRDESDLIVTPRDDAMLRADSLALAQFLYSLIHNKNAREAIDTLTTKVVLILGNFRDDRKRVLDAMRNSLRKLNLVPVIFDFAVPASKDTTGTVETLARISNFVIADLTDPSSVPHELATTVPYLRTTPVQLIRQIGATGYSMVRDLSAYPWVLAIHEYESETTLVDQISVVIEPAVLLADKLRGAAAS